MCSLAQARPGLTHPIIAVCFFVLRDHILHDWVKFVGIFWWEVSSLLLLFVLLLFLTSPPPHISLFCYCFAAGGHVFNTSGNFF